MTQVGMCGEQDEFLSVAADSAGSHPLPEHLLQRQKLLVDRAKELQKRFGDPVDRLAELLSTLPPDDHPFWVEILETE